MDGYVLISGIILGASYLLFRVFRSKWKPPEGPMPKAWKELLREYVHFYNGLDSKRKILFEFEVMEFLANYKITGIETEVEDLDKILIASSGVIPIFAFPDWRYTNLDEIILYPKSFNKEFQNQEKGSRIHGMVGDGYMSGKMILSRNALRQGFLNKTDKNNTGIHEFIHLIDHADGSIDGLPEVLIDKQFALPWFDLIEKKVEEIVKEESDIRDYAAYNRQEFFAVLGEYFFERPDLLKRKHPELYKLLEQVFARGK